MASGPNAGRGGPPGGVPPGGFLRWRAPGGYPAGSSGGNPVVAKSRFAMKMIPRQRTSGIALIIVMICITVLSILAAGFAYAMKVETKLAMNFQLGNRVDVAGYFWRGARALRGRATIDHLAGTVLIR